MKELPNRSLRTAFDLQELFATMLRPEVPVLLDRLQAELARAPAASAAPVRECCIGSVKALRMRREEFLPLMLESLQRRCSDTLLAARQTRIQAPKVPHGTTALRLLDDEATDEEGTLTAIASRHEHRASLALLLLGQRFGVLLGSPPLAATELPVGPRALGDAVASAAHRIGLCPHASMVLYKLLDLELMTRYPGFAEAMDAHVDQAGILPGLAFVPFRRAPASTQEQDDESADPFTREAQASVVVNKALDALRQAGRLPESMTEQRNMTIAAMSRFLLRHGQDSHEWQECLRCARAVIDAAQRHEPLPDEVRAWIQNALGSVGYSGDDASKFASALASVAVVEQPVTPKTEGMLGVREQRCRQLLATLPLGTRLGFSTGGGFMRSRLRYYYEGPGLLLLANDIDGQEALFELDVVARQMAEGQAWVIRRSPGPASTEPASTEVERDPGADGRGGGQWPGHVRGRELS